MNTSSAIKLLDGCEKGLRELLGKAAGKGDYSAVLKLTSWAKVIHDLAEDARNEPPVLASGSGRKSALSSSAPSQTKFRGKSQKLKTAKPVGYPRFFRDGEELIKLGWSKRKGTEYQHKAPVSVLMLLASRLAVVGAGGRMFSTENVLPLTTTEGSQIPDYQVYLCLAWLRSDGLVRQHGRQGYTVTNGDNITAATNAHWQTLAGSRN
jgi:hypothetical protein